jgi:hypothetical protein
MSDFLVDKVLPASCVLMMLILLAFLCFLPFAIQHEANEHSEFMSECRQHEPNYRCEALWRATSYRGDGQ